MSRRLLDAHTIYYIFSARVLYHITQAIRHKIHCITPDKRFSIQVFFGMSKFRIFRRKGHSHFYDANCNLEHQKLIGSFWIIFLVEKQTPPSIDSCVQMPMPTSTHDVSVMLKSMRSHLYARMLHFMGLMMMIYGWFDFCHLKLPHHWLRMFNPARDIDQCNKSTGDLIPKVHTNKLCLLFPQPIESNGTKPNQSTDHKHICVLNMTPMRGERVQREYSHIKNVIVNIQHRKMSGDYRIMQTNYETRTHSDTHSVSIFRRSTSTSKPTEISEIDTCARKNVRPTVRLKNEMKFVFMTHLLFVEVDS